MPTSPCARGCCWTPYGCAQPDPCTCHWGDWLNTPRERTTPTVRRPTEDQAIRNIMRDRRKPR